MNIPQYHVRYLDRRQSAADWHGNQAAKAYRKRDYPAYSRHARIADAIWGEK